MIQWREGLAVPVSARARLHFKTGRGRHRNNVQLGRFGRNRSNVWHYPGVNSFSRRTGEGDLLALHPTVKPVALLADAILDCTACGDIVLDGFLGSGTTVIAAERTGRRCYGMELDPAYVDTAIRRWQMLTGGKAYHAVSGRRFDDLASEAEAAEPDDKEDYEVGYGKPPHHTRFRPGQSGNPRGRPKAAKNLSTLVHDALNERVVVAENGRRRKISRFRAMITKFVNRAAQGDLKATQTLLIHLRGRRPASGFAVLQSSPVRRTRLCAELHNRMPVVLAPEAWPTWLGEEPAEPEQLKAMLLAPYPADGMVAWPISQRVGNVRNNEPSLIEPLAA